MKSQTFYLSGLTCGKCAEKVKASLLTVETVKSVHINENNDQVVLFSDNLMLEENLQAVLNCRYKITSRSVILKASWWLTYKPVLLIFFYLTAVTLLLEINDFQITRWMRHFMAGFFLIFSFFKMLNITAFKRSYTMYDVIARRFPSWGGVYVFIEFFLGISFLVNFYSVYTNLTALVIMIISIFGVIQVLLKKEEIQCACLGDVFKLPMSTISLIEDGLMIIMSLTMLVSHY